MFLRRVRSAGENARSATIDVGPSGICNGSAWLGSPCLLERDLLEERIHFKGAAATFRRRDFFKKRNRAHPAPPM